MGYTLSQAKAFIEEIAPFAQKAYKEIGKVHPSVCIGMAIVESAAGTSNIMRKNNAFLGHKVGSGKTATKYWSGKFFVARTSEEYEIGKHTVIHDAFRSFDSMEQCVFNFYELLATPLYKKVESDVDYRTQMNQIKLCGYMTSSTEVSSVLNLIEKFDLQKYDLNTEQVPISIQKRRTIRRGMSGSDVILIQKILVSQGYDIGKYGVDGRYGPDCEKAIRTFQSERDMVVDGIVGPKTWMMLEKYN